jgi:hypothetical protein
MAKKFNKYSKKALGEVVSRIQNGEIPRDDDSVDLADDVFAKKIIDRVAKLKSKNQSRTTSKGDYRTIKRIDVKDKESVASRILERKFGRLEDYIELHIYNQKGTLLKSIENFTGYSPNPVQSTTNASEDLVNSFNISPNEVLQDFGYNYGKFTLILNIQRHKIFNTFARLFTIKEISSDRTELRVISTKVTKDELRREIPYFVNRLHTSSFFKDFILNFGANKCVVGINATFKEQAAELFIKLYEPLESSIKKGTSFRIVDDLADPIELKIDLGEPEVLERDEFLRGPNFKIDTRLLNSVPSEYKTLDTALEYSLTSSYSHLLQQLENYETPNVQYDYIRPITDTGSLEVAYHFDNFVHFGSATERLKNFKYKLELIELYDAQVADIETITGPTSESVVVKQNKEAILSKKQDLIKGFDGYERYMYFEDGIYTWPKMNSTPPYTLYPTTSSQAELWYGDSRDVYSNYGGQLLSASLFDRQNPHSLTNLIPEHIANNTNNEQYSLFVNMVGQHFDQLWTYIHHITKQKDTHHKYGVSKNLVYTALKSLGVETFDQFENANLIEYILGEGSQGSPFYDTPANQTLVTSSNEGSIPKGDITKEVWKRLYHNAPYLLKTKGTERGIRALINCYGLPTTILNVKEYGGPVKDMTGYKTFSYEKSAYSLQGYSGTTDGYFIKTPWSSSTTDGFSASAKTVEFRIKPHRSLTTYPLFTLSGSSPQNDPILTLTPYNSTTDISSSGDNDQYGKLDLYLNGAIAASTTNFPVYNGDFWNIFISTQGTSGSSDNVKFGAYRSNFLKNVLNYTSSVLIGEQTRSLSFGDPYYGGNNFGGALNAYIGGVPNNGASAYSPINDLHYSGSLQEIRYHFGEELSHDTLKKHALEPFMYSGNTISSSFDNLVFRLPLGSNNILTYSSGSYHPKQRVEYFTDASITSNISTYEKWEPYDETHHLPTPDTVGASMTSEKTRIDEGTIDDDILSINIRSETSTLDRQAQDYEDLGVFFSPQNEINEDIIYTLGAFRLDDYIGSPLPSAQTSSNYTDLSTLRDTYFQKYKNSERYNIWDYTKLIQYIDHTLFKIIEQHVPAKANLKTGLLIEPHYLERNKFARSLPTTDEYQTMVTDSHQHFRFGLGPLYKDPTAEYILTEGRIPISTEDGVILDEPQYGAQAPINPVVTTGTPSHYKPYVSSVLLGNCTKAKYSSIYFRSLQLGKETDY